MEAVNGLDLPPENLCIYSWADNKAEMPKVAMGCFPAWNFIKPAK